MGSLLVFARATSKNNKTETQNSWLCVGVCLERFELSLKTPTHLSTKFWVSVL